MVFGLQHLNLVESFYSFKKPFVYVPGGLEMWIGLDVVGTGDGHGLVAEEKVLSPAPGLIEECGVLIWPWDFIKAQKI